MSTFDTATIASANQVSTTTNLRSLVLTVLLVWILSIPCAEIVFRLLGERTTTDLAGLYQPFGRGRGYKLRPNIRADADTLLGRFSVLTNEFGLRCGKADLQSGTAGRQIDILVLGDSQAYGEGLSYENTLAGQLTELASKQALVVNNAAVGGHYLENQFELLQWLDQHGVRPRRVVALLTPYLITTPDATIRLTWVLMDAYTTKGPALAKTSPPG